MFKQVGRLSVAMMLLMVGDEGGNSAQALKVNVNKERGEAHNQVAQMEMENA